MANKMPALFSIKKNVNIHGLIAKISQDKKNLILAIFVIIIFIALDFVFVLQAQMRAVGAINPKLAELRKEIQTIKNDLIEMQTQTPLPESEEIKTKNLASQDQMSWLIEEISRIANEKAIKIFNIKPSRGGAKDNYPSIFFNLDVAAGYFQLVDFLSELENHSILFEVEEMNIRGNDKDPFEHMINLRLRTYCLG